MVVLINGYMTTKYDQIKYIHLLVQETHNASHLGIVLQLLKNWGIELRKDDGELQWINLSIPTSDLDVITIGLRYKKRDVTFTEDIFELDKKIQIR